VFCGTAELLCLLLERGIDPNLEDRDGQTALHHFCSKRPRDSELARACVKVLLEFGAGPVDKQIRYGTAVGVCDGVWIIGGRKISGTSGPGLHSQEEDCAVDGGRRDQLLSDPIRLVELE
jgi:ankyrin repeat protein